MQHDVVAGDTVGQLQQFGSILEVDERHAVIEGIVAAAEGADEGEALDARQEAGGTRGHLRHDDGDFVAGFGVDLFGQHFAQDEVEITRLQLRSHIRIEVGKGFRDFALFVRVNALQNDALEALAIANQTLPLHIGGIGDEFGAVREVLRRIEFGRDDTRAVVAAQHGV